MKGRCKLCLNNTELLKKSHIIPDFMYSGLFDKSHSLIKINFDHSSHNKLFSGEYESNILCANCDNTILGSLENYGRKIIYGGKRDKNDNIKEYEDFIKGSIVLCIDGVNYHKFKLFLLSVLWRSSVSSRPFFKNVNLGPYEEMIRLMILNNDAGDKFTTPFFLSHLSKDVDSNIITSPLVSKKDGRKYLFLIDGLWFMFFVSQNKVPDDIQDFILDYNGLLRVPILSGEVSKKIFGDIFRVNLLDKT